MSVHAVHNNDRDTCVTVTEAVKAGDTVEYSLSDGTKHSVTALNDVPAYHKVAASDVPKGGSVYKYGEKIGVALCDIRTGEHVHTHNIASTA